MKKFYGLSLLIIVMMCVGWVKSSAQNYRWEWGYNYSSSDFDNSNSLTVTDNGIPFSGSNGYVSKVAYRGKKYDSGYKLNSNNTIKFTVPRLDYPYYLNNSTATVTIAFFIRPSAANDPTYITITKQALNPNNNTETQLPYTLTYSEKSNGYAVLTTTLSYGDYTISSQKMQLTVGAKQAYDPSESRRTVFCALKGKTVHYKH